MNAVLKLMYRGVPKDTPGYLAIAQASTNVIVLLMFVLSTSWAVLSLVVVGMPELFRVHFLVAVLSLLLFIASEMVAFSVIRPVALLLGLSYFGMICLTLGYHSGVEFYAVPLMFWVFVVTPEHGDHWTLRLRVLAALAVLLIFGLMEFTTPLIPLSLEQLKTGYRITLVFVVLFSCIGFLAYGTQMKSRFEQLEREKARASDALSSVLPDIVARRLQDSGKDELMATSHGGARCCLPTWWV